MNAANDAPFVVPESIADDEVWHCFTMSDNDKIPCEPHKRTSYINAFDPDPRHLVDFETAFEAVDEAKRSDMNGPDGVMLNLSTSDLTVIDLDDVVADDGKLSELAYNLTEDLDNTYWEISPSGKGLHGYIYDAVGVDEEYIQKDDDGIECYDSRAVTFTGRHVEGTSKTILDMNGALRAYQHRYNRKKSADITESGSTSLSTDVARDEGLGTEEFEGLVGADTGALSDQQREVVDAMCKYDDDACALYEEGHDASCACADKSRNDMSLMGRIAWWGQTADMFDFELSQSEIEEIFLTSELANRSKIQDRPGLVSLAARKAIN